MQNRLQEIARWLQRPLSIYPLITFRILFGGLMLAGIVRFALNGWIDRLYLEPTFFFKFYGFEWVQPLGELGMYSLFFIAGLSAGLIMLGLFYRIATIVFFLSFTYIELIDVTNYLNHYYLICLLAFLLIFLPANRAYALDVSLFPKLRATHIPAWTIYLILFQLGLVYFCAGFAKLNADWLFRAMPLAVWLPTKTDIPILNNLFQYGWMAYAFSWAGALYDLTIVFFLLNRKTRPFAYIAVIVFHGLTWLLFNIGLFPFIMTFSTLLFFSADFHRKLLGLLDIFAAKANWQPQLQQLRIANLPKLSLPQKEIRPAVFVYENWQKRLLAPLLTIYIILQVLLPFRYLCYPGNVLWHEQGYRFAWRVMLVEKSGQATFFVHDTESGRKGEVVNTDYLTPYQAKQMAIQPDLILQFAHYLETIYKEKYGIKDATVTVESFVALNGRPSQRFIDPNVDLTTLQDSFAPKSWILPFEEKN